MGREDDDDEEVASSWNKATSFESNAADAISMK
jgi:hypothetical protein